MGFLVKLALFLLLLLVILKLIMRFIRVNFTFHVHTAGGAGRPGQGMKSPTASEMVRDPVCGAYVAAEQAERVDVGAGSVYFCSRKCMEEYRRKLAG